MVGHGYKHSGREMGTNRVVGMGHNFAVVVPWVHNEW